VLKPFSINNEVYEFYSLHLIYIYYILYFLHHGACGLCSSGNLHNISLYLVTNVLVPHGPSSPQLTGPCRWDWKVVSKYQ